VTQTTESDTFLREQLRDMDIEELKIRVDRLERFLTLVGVLAGVTAFILGGLLTR
jgi:hypothetical protein